jgi:hypothetical protein
MLRIMKALKLLLVLLSVIFVIAGVLWYPYGSGVVPTWRIQIIDADGHPMAGIRVNQEWLDPIDDGITSVDTRQTDMQGFVVFPKRSLHNRLALGNPRYRPGAHIFMCGHEQFGQAFWEEKDLEMVGTVELKRGPCPFG